MSVDKVRMHQVPYQVTRVHNSRWPETITNMLNTMLEQRQLRIKVITVLHSHTTHMEPHTRDNNRRQIKHNLKQTTTKSRQRYKPVSPASRMPSICNSSGITFGWVLKLHKHTNIHKIQKKTTIIENFCLLGQICFSISIFFIYSWNIYKIMLVYSPISVPHLLCHFECPLPFPSFLLKKKYKQT